jgi:potassium efflux system protein
LPDAGATLPAIVAACSLLNNDLMTKGGASRAFAVAAALLLGACTVPGDGAPRDRPATGFVAKAHEPEGPGTGSEPVDLADLPEVVGKVEALRRRALGVLVPGAEERATSAGLDEALVWLAEASPAGDVPPFDEVIDLTHRLAEEEHRIVVVERGVTHQLRAVQAHLQEGRTLHGWLDALAVRAEESSAPPEMMTRIGICRRELDELDARLADRRETVLVDVSRLADVRGRLATLGADSTANLLELRDHLAEPSAEPIWRLRVGGREALALAAERASRSVQSFGRYVEGNAARLALVAVFVLVGTGTLLWKLRPWTTRRAGSGPQTAAVPREIGTPWEALVLITVVALVLVAPLAPSVVYDVAYVLMAPAAASIAVKFLGPGVSRTAWAIGISLALLPLRRVAGFGQLADRVVLLLQTVPLCLALAADLGRDRWQGLLGKGPASSLLSAAGWALAGALGAAALASVGGWVVLAAVLSSGALRALGWTIAIAASFLVLDELLRALIASHAAQRLRMVRFHPDAVARAGRRVLRLFAVGTALFVTAVEFRIETPASRAVQALLRATLTLGSMSISIVSVLVFTVVLTLAVLLSRVASFVLSEEILPRLDLKRGIAFAVSVAARYLVLLAGFVLAAGAAGIDLSKVGFLAGAFGVGIGFGLQNLVSNFVSGLILILERPIRIDDAIEASGASGRVVRIGIRSSTVRTVDGADVFIPSADLISKSVTNWTRSDPSRRFDVPVGVAHGSAHETTARALLAAARRTQGVAVAPAPEAILDSFGASALVWHLRVWVGLAEAPTVLGQLNRAVDEELAKAGLEVALPQLDVQVRTARPRVGEADAGRTLNPRP